MNVSLTPALERLLRRKVASGRYGSASEVVREALRLLEEQDRLREERARALRSAIDVGLRDVERGRVKPFDADAVRRIKARGRKRLAGSSKRA